MELDVGTVISAAVLLVGGAIAYGKLTQKVDDQARAIKDIAEKTDRQIETWRSISDKNIDAVGTLAKEQADHRLDGAKVAGELAMSVQAAAITLEGRLVRLETKIDGLTNGPAHKAV